MIEEKFLLYGVNYNFALGRVNRQAPGLTCIALLAQGHRPVMGRYYSPLGANLAQVRLNYLGINFFLSSFNITVYIEFELKIFD